MDEQEQQEQKPQGYITLKQNGQQWEVDSNVANWEWHILQIAAQIKRTL
jgi:hypothetical protein